MSAEFRRLDTVRARRRARRRQGLRAAAATVGVAALVAATGWGAAWLMPGPPLMALASGLPTLVRSAWPPGHAHGPPGAAHGETRGWVQTLDPDTGFIRVSSGLFGLTSVVLQVTPDTLIVVGDKEGGFGDIRLGERVSAAYEIRPDGLQARRVDVLSPARDGGS
jgi:hypothetical protein